MTSPQPTERWRPVVGYEGYYEVSDLGRVRSLRAGRVLKPMVSGRAGRPRYSVALHRGLRDVRSVHHLVLEAFLGPRPAGMVACHTDDDATNNRLENLRWDTSSANAHDRVRNQRDANARKTHCANGHEYTAENTMYSPQPHGWNARRSCRICKREAWHRWNASKAW